MKKKIFAFLLIYLPLLIFSENQMELIAELTGEHPRSKFGYSSASLDFNGDGIDDLAVGANNWDPDYEGWPASADYYGKIYLYFGKTEGFTDTVSLTVSMYDSLRSVGKHLENLGDMNGDGCEELGFFSYYHDNEQYIGHNFANILLGNNVCDSIPDYIYDFTSSEGYAIEHFPQLKWLGDINGDGYDDAGFVISHRDNPNEDVDWVHIIYGNEFEPQYFKQIEYDMLWTRINGVGDINNDGYDDFIIGEHNNNTITKLLYFGNTIIDSTQYVRLTDNINSNYFDTTGGVAIGDWNGDGIDDFNGGRDSSGPDIWLGSVSQNLVQNMHINFSDWLLTRQNDYGDLNGDGRDDFVGGDYGGFTGANGNVYAYFGGQNGTCDIEFEGEYGVELGWSVSVGDFNNDGFDDIAAGGSGHGAMGDQGYWCGKVFVYAGNADLEEADPDVEISEEITQKPEIIFNTYPNPFNPTVKFEIEAKNNNLFEIEIYNIKGQCLKKIKIDNHQSVKDFPVWNGKDSNNNFVSSGVYFCKLIGANNIVLATQKITLMK